MSSSDTPKTVLLSGDPLYREGIAGGVITPGMLIEQAAAGTFSAHGTAAGLSPSVLIARTEEYAGGALDNDYAVSDTLPYMAARSGDRYFSLVAAAAGAIVIGDTLESAGDGTVRKSTVAGAVFARAIAAVDNSGGATVARIKMEII